MDNVDPNRILEPIIELGAVSAMFLVFMIAACVVIFVLWKELKETRGRLIKTGEDQLRVLTAMETSISHLIDLVKRQ